MHENASLRASRRHAVRAVDLAAPLRWLVLGWHDLLRRPLPGLLHGLALALFGAALFALARERFWLLAGAFSGFLLVAPVLATGLYALSRALERGEPATLATALRSWVPHDHRLPLFGVLLSAAGTGWVVTSASLITGFTGAAVAAPADFVRLVVLDSRTWWFETWLLVGGALAAPVFASSVVALPLLLDRPDGVLAAVLTSWRCVLANPLPLALWALLIMALTALGMATLLLGLVVVVPWLAHASWHAYRDLVADSPADAVATGGA
ncbi:MAG: DUF2189 domain-containing protein [Ideonella sp.]|nr:DUF2189 domain-containing protein [Ideonella sp.]MCC7458648.1 DUF2189 domain-containing protein [Nitrospira sp.]